jgi:hypothetical protein
MTQYDNDITTPATMQDRVNALFEAVGVIAALINCYALINDGGIVRGVSLLSILFFTAWGAWNLYYYRHLNQPASQFAAGGLLIANALWLALYIYYRAVA